MHYIAYTRKNKTLDVPPSISKNFEDLQFMVSGLSRDLDLLRLEINNRLLTMEQTLQIIQQQQAESSQSLSTLLDILRNIFSLPWLFVFSIEMRINFYYAFFWGGVYHFTIQGFIRVIIIITFLINSKKKERMLMLIHRLLIMLVCRMLMFLLLFYVLIIFILASMFCHHQKGGDC